MCTCSSCKVTDALAGWKEVHEKRVPDLKRGGFDRWPRGNPAGRRSASDYAAHVAYARKGAIDGMSIGPKGIAFYGGGKRAAEVLAATFAHQVECAWVPTDINPAEEKTGQAEAQPASPAAPGKAPQHFPELDRQPEALHYSANDTETEMALKYMTVARAAESWGIAQSRVRQWLADGRIKGAQKLGGIWLIPDGAERPKAAKPGELQAARK